MAVFFSLQSYERQGKEVRNEKEAKLWQMITPDMMSDEEILGDVYIRHPPTYRSDKLNKFLSALDQRAEKSHAKTAHPRIARQLGSPVTRPAPVHAKKWMTKQESDSHAQIQDCEEEHSSEGDSGRIESEHELFSSCTED